MSAKIATGSEAQTVQKWVINSDVENQLRSYALRRRLLDVSLSHGSIELFLRCSKLAAIGWGNDQPLGGCHSFLRVDLSGCPKLESIPQHTFSECYHLVSVLFGEHSIITNLGEFAFTQCFALASIPLHEKFKVIEKGAFTQCTSLERVVCNKNLKTVGDCAFHACPKLEDVQLASSSISFGIIPFAAP